MPRTALHDAKTAEEVHKALRAGVDVDALDDQNGKTALMLTAQEGGEHGAGMMRVLLDAGADANKQDEDGWTALMLAATPAAHAQYVCGAQEWTPLHRAADARDFSALFALLRERPPLHERHDDAVASPHADMRTALSIAASNSYPCAAPVDERCVALLRSGAVWSSEHHARVPEHERLAASARTLMLGVTRWDVEGKPYKADIGPARGEDGVERRLPREIWELIFSCLIFDEGYRDARRAKRRRTS